MADAGLALYHLRLAWLESYERRHGEVRLGKLTGAPARKAIVFVLIMTVHSFGEGSVFAQHQNTQTAA